MCDETQLANMRGELSRSGRMNRRSFGAIGTAAVLAGCTPAQEASSEESAMDASGVMVTPVSIPTDAGTADGFFYHPAEGAHAAIIEWPDIAGVRPATRTMAERLAGEGYAVLHMNPYYRDVSGTQFEDFAGFAESGGFQTVGPWREKLTPDAVMADAKAFVAWLDEQGAVDTAKGIGANGHCMTGSWSFYAAHAVPDRVKAASSMHGGGLVTDGPQSPHKLMEPGTAYLVAIAKDDDEKDPEAKTVLKDTAAEKGVDAEVEVYDGNHGWTVIDSPKYAEAAAEKAWARMMALFSSL
ncbi:dienelactone hydrolase family protein [Croceicoccus mobilis]|uniref:Hydrolase n=1 Tax=Croceicoccus mobilis TaxID=1703339 RepID=A0A917DR16_9SPHN|nr:dienelactone hydrolase family protein [Croceicoccus mobilis]GGD58771.1 hydrolase [Croceicoccus mobilis]